MTKPESPTARGLSKAARKRRKGNPHGRGKAPKVTLPATPTSWDRGATGPANRIGLVVEDAAELDPVTGKSINPNGVKRVRRVDMLEVWHRKGLISAAGFNAAEKLRDAFDATQRSPGWPDNDRVQSSPKPDHAVTIQIDRLSRFHAINKLVVAGDAEIIDLVVLRRASFTAIKRYRGRGYQAGIDHVRQALERLARTLGC